MINKAEIMVYGRVQKAGYKDFIDEIAFNLNVNGKVKNLDNGTVQIICEGSENGIKELIKKIDIRQYPVRVEKIDIVSMIPIEEANKEFTSFEIVREEDLTLATYERMDSAARYIREMNSNLGDKIDSLGTCLGGKIDSFKTETADNFGKMDKKYDKISDNMFAIVGEMKITNKLFEERSKVTDIRMEKTEKSIEELLKILVGKKTTT
jgi:acylphosphatase